MVVKLYMNDLLALRIQTRKLVKPYPDEDWNWYDDEDFQEEEMPFEFKFQ